MSAQTHDLNGLGRSVAGVAWYFNNIRLRLVSVVISGLMALLLTAGVVGAVVTFASVHEIGSVWRNFDTGVARRLVLLSDLREHMGFGGLTQHFRDFILTGDPLLKQAITQDFAKLREIGPAYVTAGASAEEQRALSTIYGLVESYERAFPRVADAISRKEPAEKVHAAAAVDERPALAALEAMGEILGKEHKLSADRVEDAMWRVGATVLVVMLLTGLLLLLLAVFFYWFIRHRIVRPVDELGGVMLQLSQGNHSAVVPLIEKEDEIGDMARAVEVFKESMIRADELETQKRIADQTRVQRAQRREKLTDDFGEIATKVLSVVDESVRKVRDSATSLRTVAESTGHQANSVAAAAEQATSNAQAVASATEELSASGRDISYSVTSSADITREAVVGIESLDTTMSALGHAAEKIGEIVVLIGEIAAQTNLLALNASIEAQRAGDAGKGFAVVANEVKVLASQTARATEEIGEQVEGIQKTTRSAVGALKEVGATIQRADEVVASIASAITEQNATTQSIAQNVSHTADGSRMVSKSIIEVSAAAEHTGAMAAEMVKVTAALNAEAHTMRSEVETFLAAVKAT
jgi:methyl-accepting chemotaxis protein